MCWKFFPFINFENPLYFQAYFQPIFWTPQSIQNIQMVVNSVSPYKIVPKKHIAVIPSSFFSSLTRPSVHR
jgi:hypothetical protein